MGSADLTIAFSRDARGTLDRFAIVYPRLVELYIEIEVASQAMLDHIEMEFSHPADQRLTRLFILDRFKGRVLSLKHLQDFGQLLAFHGVFRLDGHGKHRLRKLDGWQLNHIASIAERVAGDSITRADGTGDITALQRFDLALAFLLGCMDLPKLRDVLFLIAIGDVDSRVGIERPE